MMILGVGLYLAGMVALVLLYGLVARRVLAEQQQVRAELREEEAYYRREWARYQKLEKGGR